MTHFITTATHIISKRQNKSRRNYLTNHTKSTSCYKPQGCTHTHTHTQTHIHLHMKVISRNQAHVPGLKIRTMHINWAQQATYREQQKLNKRKISQFSGFHPNVVKTLMVFALRMCIESAEESHCSKYVLLWKL